MGGKYACAFVATLAVVPVGCCATPAVIVDLESDKVVVQSGIGTSETEIYAKARDGCALHGRKPRYRAIVECMDQYCFVKRTLFACVHSPD